MTGRLGALLQRLLPARDGTGRRNGLILLDTGTTALTGVVLLVGAARSLAPEALSIFALAQLIIVTAVGILRTAFYGPAMAAQRTTGRAVVPLRWSVTIAQPATLAVTAIIALVVPDPDWHVWLLPVALATSVYLTQDAVRNVLVSRNRPKGILVADVATGLLVLAGVSLGLLPDSPSAMMVFWGLAALPGLLWAVIIARRGAAGDQRDQSLAHTWRLGRWGALDSSLAAVASIMPMVVSTALVSATASGTYRVLLSALGPLNIVFTTVLTVLMLDSWQTSTLHGLRSMTGRVRTATVLMVVGTLVYVPVALAALTWFSRLHGPEVIRAAVIVGLVGILGSASTPVTGAALALGRQHWGVGIRVITVASTVAISVGATTWVPWQDPIGLSMLVAAIVVLVGWTFAYIVATRREGARLREHPPSEASAPVR